MSDFSLWLYEGFWTPLTKLLAFFARFNPKLAGQLADRKEARSRIAEMGKLRSRYPRMALFICSSAGEYEQAKPLMQRLTQRGDFAVQILFVSPSGVRFAATQKESLPFALMATDAPSYWEEVAHHLRPDLVFFVRYELWPAMVSVLRRYAPLYLIDGVEAPHLRKKALARWLRSKLVRPLRSIFVVSDSDRDFYISALRSPPENVFVSGETKYDRVLERMNERAPALESLKARLLNFKKGRRLLVLGSAWPRDWEELRAILPELLQVDPKLAIAIAPHDLSSTQIEALRASFEGFKVCQVSAVGYEAAASDDQILIVDTLGDLPELYGCGDLAWIGGALHFRVHNVLEPACRGLYICHGPLYQTSQEAQQLVTLGLTQVIRSGAEFLEWYKNLKWEHTPPHQSLAEAVARQKGASDRILAALQTGRTLTP